MRLDEFDYLLPRRRSPNASAAARPVRGFWHGWGVASSRIEASLSLRACFGGDELIVLNNARVIPARLFGRRAGVFSDPPSRTTRREHLSGTVQVFLARQVRPDVWEALVPPDAR